MKKIYFFIIAILVAAQQNISAQACSGTPASNVALATSTAFCAGTTATLSLQSAYPQTGIVYQWAYSTASAFGPWTAISGANSPTLATTTLTDAAYYTAVIGCLNSFLSTTATAVYLNISTPGATTTVPYFEGFQVTANNILPNCSWAATSLGSNCLTYTSGPAFSGGGFAAFAYSASVLGQQSFYSMGIYMNASVVYSTNVWHSSQSSPQANNWSSFGLSVGPSQSAAGSTVVTASGPPSTGAYASRSGTFTVPANGIYYVRIFANAVTGTTIAPFIYFDDVSVTVPCNVSANGGSAMYQINPNLLCAGNTLTITATPAANCSVTGGNTQTLVTMVSVNLPMIVTNTLSGCINSTTLVLIVQPTPNQFVVSSPPVICSGKISTITVSGGGTYTLYPGATVVGSNFTLSPSTSSNYTLIAGNNFGCTNPATFALGVIPNPTLFLSLASATICKGEGFSLSAIGATVYYVGSNLYTSVINLPVLYSDSVFVITGTGSNGCQSTANISMKVSDCAGIPSLVGDAAVAIFPNPNTGTFKIVLAKDASVKIRDLSGRLIYATDLKAGAHSMQQKELSRGLYIIEVQTDSGLVKKQLVID
jgi:hypothetical protein